MSSQRWIKSALVVCVVLAFARKGFSEDRTTPWQDIDVRTAADAARAWKIVRSHFGNFRQGHRHEVWVTDQSKTPPARPIAECLAEVSKLGIGAKRRDRNCRLSAQVRINKQIEGVHFGRTKGGGDFVVGCELALRLPEIAKRLSKLGIRQIIVGPPSRSANRSYHRFGLALDVYRMATTDGMLLSVESDFSVSPDGPTCSGKGPRGKKGRILRQVACDLFDSRLLSTVITPNYDAGHRNHFHWDLRPGDPRFYLR